MLDQHSVRPVAKCRTVEQRASISYKPGTLTAVATQSAFHAWKGITQDAKQRWFASSALAHLFPYKRDAQFKALGKQSGYFCLAFRLEMFFEECTPRREEGLDGDSFFKKNTGQTSSKALSAYDNPFAVHVEEWPGLSPF